MSNSFSRGAALSALLFSCDAAQAIEYKLTTELSASRSDNIGRVSEDSGLVQSAFLYKPTLRGMLSQETNSLRIAADYVAEYRIYSDVFDDRLRVTGRADLQWDAIQDFLQFNVSNVRTETTEDSLIQNVETNRQVTSVTSAGPRLFYRPRARDELSFEYRFSDVNQGQAGGGSITIPVNQQINSDSERQLFTLAYKLGLSENRSLTAELTRDNVDFEQDAPELEIDTASLIYASKGDSLDFEARAGYTTIDRSLGRDKVDGFVGRLNLRYRVTASGEFQINASRNINDQSDSVLRGNADFGQGAVFQNSDVNEVFEELVFGISYTQRWGRNIATIGYTFQNSDFEDSAFAPGNSRDERQNSYRAQYSRRVTPRVDMRIAVNYLQREFDSRGVDEDNITGNFRVDWRAGRALSLFAGANYEDRDASGDSPFVAQLNFDEFVYLVGFRFDLVNRYKSTQQR